MESDQNLLALLDSIIQQIPASSFKGSVNLENDGGNHDIEQLDKIKTMRILVNDVLTSYIDCKLDDGQVIIIMKILKVIQYLISKSYNVMIESKDLSYEIFLQKLIPFLNCRLCEDKLINEIKFTILNMISILHEKLHNFKIQQKIANFLINNLELNLNAIFELNKIMNNSSISISNDFFDNNNEKLNKLSISIHILQILMNYKSNRLLFLDIQHDFQFESYSRKLWFLLQSHSLNIINIKDNLKNSYQLLNKIDDLSVILLNSMSSSFLNDHTPKSSKITFLLLKFKELLNWDYLPYFIKLQHELSKELLKVFIKTIELNFVKNFELNLRIANCMVMQSIKNGNTINVNPDLIKTLYIITYSLHKLNAKELIPLIDADTTLENIHMNFIETIINNSITAFDDLTLENLRLSIFKLIFKENQSMQEILPLINGNEFINIINEKEYKEDHSLFLKNWLNTLNLKIKKEEIKFESTIQKIYIINSLGNFACLYSQDYDYDSKICSKCDMQINDTSYGLNIIDKNRKSSKYEPEIVLALQILFKFAGDDENEIVKVHVLLSLRKFFASFRPPTINNKCKVWKFILTCLRSTTREIRLLSSKLIPYYLIIPEGKDYEENFQIIVSDLQMIKFNDAKLTHLAESTVMAWGELAIVSGIDEKLVLILMKLIDFLGSENQFHSMIAFHEFLIISKSKKKTPWQLLAPFLPNLSVIIVKQMKSKPIILAKICELVAVTVDSFLARTQAYTVPHLLTYYKHDLIGDVSQKIKISRFELIHKNFSRIIAYLLTFEDKISQKKIMQILGNAASEFKGRQLTELVDNNSIAISWEVLKIYSPESNNHAKIKNALLYIASTLLPNETNPLEVYLERTILGIVQNFSESTYDVKGLQPFIEKLRAIWAIDCLIAISGKSIVSALPQIMACIQTNLELSHLHYESLRCLKILIKNLSQSNLSIILDLILSLILQKWSQFSEKTKLESKEILNILFKEHEALIKKKYFNYIFSLSFNPELLGIYNNARVTFPNSIKGTSFSLLHDLTLRSKNENKFVVAQALSDLEYYFKKYQNEFHSSYVNNPSFINYIPVLRSTLLEVSHKFRSSDVEIPTKCAIVFGLMGSLDFNKFNNFSVISSDEKDQLIILKQFTDRNEVYRFLIIFVKSVLVKAFWASTDPVKQLFLAYAMQEYMKLLELNGIDVESFSKDEINKTSTPAIIWSKFDDISKSTLLPLLSSKYIVNGSKNENLTYPIYKTWMKHSKWLRDFTLDLLRKSKHEGINPAAQKIFLICTSIIKDQDLSICNFILPYATLNLILCKDEKIEKEIETEMLAILGSNVSGVNDNSTAEHLKSCYQSVFGILDYFKKWCSARKQKKKRADLSSISTKTFNEETSLVENFLNRMPQELIAKRSAECNSYERAILNLEESYRSSKIERNEFFSTIQSMYVEIDDLDALDGVLKKFSTQSLTDKLLQFQYSDNWKIAQDCFEALSESDLNREKVKDTTDLLKSLNDYSLYDSSLEKLDAQLSLLNGNLNMLASEWVRIGLNSSVYAGNLHALKKWIYVTESNIKPSSLTDSALFIDYEFAKALVFLAEDKIEDTVSHINKAFQLLGYSLAMSKETSLSRTRSIINQLHCLTDLKEIALSTSKSKSESNIKTLDLRYSNVSNDFQSCWRILSTRRAADNLHPNDFTKNDISNIWIESAKIARKSERLDLATKSIMNAMLLENQKVDLEYAKLLWAQGDHSRALKAIDELRSSDNERSIRENALIQLKYTKWLDSSDSGNSSTIIDEYNKAAKMDVKWEKPYYLLGKYFNKILENQSIVSEDIKSSKDFYGDYERRLVFNYLRALQCGSKYLFEALPKVITVWLDFASKYKDKVPRFKNEEMAIERKKNYDLIKESIKQSINLIPAICWYTVLSQLISRALHPNPEAAEQVMDLVSKITEAYPEQALWSVFAQSKSTITERSKMGNNILSNIIQRPSNPEESVKRKNTIKSAINLFDALLGVCMKEVNKKRSDLILSTDFGFDHKVTPCVSLVVPLRSNFEIKLPASFDLSSKNYKSFPIGSKITIIKFDEHVKILSSMQKPRRLAILGSNGGKYHILCKPHDDLRKDAKLMEFTTMIDRLLKKDDESEKRKLSITSYAVVPLNETYGVLEWVDSCRTMRDIVLSYLTSIGKPLDFSFCKKMLAEDQSLQEKITGLNRLIKEYPPVFRLWFLEEFPDPKAWYGARCNYTRSSAVMSIIGYILGMGDRHGDNILMLEKTGGVLHVDFDCLFDKGLTLAVPERVPFRLTSNMVDAFGISGVEGAFRKSCEVTMRLVRNHEPALMNILESFLYDPILDWSATKRRKKHDSHNPEVSLNNIKKKIRGIEKDASLSLSIPAHVDAVISQAVSPENLAQMYIGWMSFI